MKIWIYSFTVASYEGTFHAKNYNNQQESLQPSSELPKNISFNETKKVLNRIL